MIKFLSGMGDYWWHFMTAGGANNKYEFGLFIVAYAAFLPTVLYATILGFLTIIEDNYPLLLTIQWCFMPILLIIMIAGLIGTTKRYKKFMTKD